jgi:hypothetical protein
MSRALTKVMHGRFPALALVVASTLLSSAAYAQTKQEPAPQKEPSPSKEQAESSEPNPKSKLVWLDAEGGLSSTNLHTFSADFDRFAVGFLPQSGVGPMGGAAVGLRFVFLTVGVRGRVASYQDDDPSRNVRSWTMSSLNGEVGLRAPLSRFEPFMTVGAGYTTFGGFGSAIDGAGRGLNVNGANARLSLGFDYFVARFVSLGVLGTGEVLMLTRPGVPLKEVAALPGSKTADVAAVRFLEARGSTYGSALALTGGLKVHF